MSETGPLSSPRPLFGLFSSLRVGALGLAVTSCLVNVLALTGSFFMLQVYDRVIPSRSLPTLVGLIVIVVALFAFQWLLDLTRSLLLGQIGRAVDERFSGRAFLSVALSASRKPAHGDGLQTIRDVDTVRGFLSGPGPGALFDLPWMPFYLALCFLFHHWIGVTAAAGAMILTGLALLAEVKSRQPTRETVAILAERMAFAETARRNSETVVAMGFAAALSTRWAGVNRRHLDSHLRTATVVNSLSTLSRSARMLLQPGVLAVGAILVIRQEATGGIMIASSILVSRALAPIELAIAHWRGFAAARQAWSRLDREVRLSDERPRVALPAPRQSLLVENLHLGAPGSKMPIIRGMSFEVKAGEAVGIIGPSASGKSSLARGLVGLWSAFGGDIRLDGASLSQWTPAALGRHIGYLPQEVSLFEGTIADNIARFDPQTSSELVIAAARAAGVYDMIVGFSDGFDTLIGAQATALSAGQRQRIGLARALYGDPFLVVLDEPNSNLDVQGELALAQAIESVRSRQGVVLIIAHRPSALSVVDKVLVLEDGRAKAFGPKGDVLKTGPKPVAATGSFVRLLRAGEGTSP
ncbi:type I secretion protein [Rhizobium sp. R72]|uniref:type I secretion system permease/ATPase n=1 Tax=unclassified Rhizobium TaxID=2613769 RepID=UPI000B5315D1|nr:MULTISPECIES: type I secretion system permease/ATPase [unclassified Rhizobium]OWW04840.1 type I secretion protein [Rhizobium sp. R72]OWW05897.1 type I secretion protein [Rhizobium sp. R711]